MPVKYLITGATGGLGGQILRYLVANVSPSDFAAASSKAANRSSFEDRGIAFRHINYKDQKSLDQGLEDVENLLMVSSYGTDRLEQHTRVVAAAKKAGVKHIWYTSLAFGGLEDNAKSPPQEDHILTERLLKESGVTFTSIREGAYAEAFPFFLDWYPDTTEVVLPADGHAAYTSRTDLGEASARIMISGGYENQVVLFTALATITAKEMVDVINETTDRRVQFRIVDRDNFLRRKLLQHEGTGKGKEYFETVAIVWDDIVAGALSTTHPLMGEILGREPISPREAIRALLSEKRDYTYL
ncbi:NAD(P)-binding protein [Aureobasidium namibiae CBS 147.97]|uniref:NAD(P)-binding protein n=1 Tax=Aureobasidium namibiae CBS 147.97 TaxID=1043004 RepID=A0A074W5X0_9PEZI